MPTTYTSPGVYVEEVPSAVQPIVGVGTSTAGFIGVIPDKVIVPFRRPDRVLSKSLTVIGGNEGKLYQLDHTFPVITDQDTFEVRVVDTKVVIDAADAPKSVKFSQVLPTGADVMTNCQVTVTRAFAYGEVKDNAVLVADYPANKLLNATATIAPTAGGDPESFAIKNIEDTPGQTRIVFTKAPSEDATITITYSMRIQQQKLEKAGASEDTFQLPPGVVKEPSYEFDHKAPDMKFWYVDPKAKLHNQADRSVVIFTTAPPEGAEIECDCDGPYTTIVNEIIGKWDGKKMKFPLKHYPAAQNQTATFKIGEPEHTLTPTNNEHDKVALVDFTGLTGPLPIPGTTIMGTYLVDCSFSLEDAGKPILCTSFSEFKRHFGSFSTDSNQRRLAHAVQGFFLNGGTRCYVMRVAQEGKITKDLLQTTFATIDEIAIVAAPGITGSAAQEIVTHCENEKLQDRFAILDSPETIEDTSGEFDVTRLQKLGAGDVPTKSNYAAFYTPWIQVSDPASQLLYPDDKEKWRIYVPPSGHIAGIYGRVDTERGVHKAPANEAVRGALGLKYLISRAQQEGLNPIGVNCIRELNGSILVWGARTLGGNANSEWKYINVRRLFLFLRESIDEGTQWVVFEPNTPDLWAKITRNITAFLTTVWRSGVLFGATPQEAFYVKCDAELNPPEERDLGRVWTEIGVAVAKPAEFVIFRISQWAGPGG